MCHSTVIITESLSVFGVQSFSPERPGFTVLGLGFIGLMSWGSGAFCLAWGCFRNAKLQASPGSASSRRLLLALDVRGLCLGEALSCVSTTVGFRVRWSTLRPVLLGSLLVSLNQVHERFEGGQSCEGAIAAFYCWGLLS